MTIIKALQLWLEQFDGGIDIQPMQEVLTDSTEELPYSYALAPSGSDLVSRDVSSGRNYRYNYVLYIKAHGANESDREDNYRQLEAVVDWIEQRDDARDYPALDGERTVTEISCGNAMLFDLYEDGTALYQLQIQMTFEKEVNLWQHLQ